MEEGLERAEFFHSRQRYREAEKELMNVLSRDPNNASAHALLSSVFQDQNKIPEAMREIETAISLNPTQAYYFYLKAHIHGQKSEFEIAHKEIDIAIALDPLKAGYRGIKGNIFLHQKEWEKALEAVNEGLALDPEELNCLNIRATCLIKLNRKDEAFRTIETALNQDPENQHTHTNTGWAMLEKGEHEKALNHFSEALRLDPQSSWAKTGLVEALKARYFLYRLFLRYLFWVSNLKGNTQWLFIIGLFLGIQMLKGISASNPELVFIIRPIIACYILFALTTWIAVPLFNLILSMSSYGRYALTEDEITSANIVGILLFLGSVFGLAYLVTSSDVPLAAAILFFSLCLPAGSMNMPQDPGAKRLLRSFTALLAVIGLAALFVGLVEGHFASTASVIYFGGFLFYHGVANYLISK